MTRPKGHCLAWTDRLPKTEGGSHEARFVVYHLDDNPAEPYVTWIEVRPGNNPDTWYYTAGTYCLTFDEAFESMKRRGDIYHLEAHAPAYQRCDACGYNELVYTGGGPYHPMWSCYHCGATESALCGDWDCGDCYDEDGQPLFVDRHARMVA